MSRTSYITCATVLAAMTKPHNHLVTLTQLAAQFGISEQGMGYYVKKLVAAGDVYAAKSAGGGKPAQYALTNPPVRYVGEVTPPFKTTCWTPAMCGYEAGMRSFAALAMAGR